MVVRDGLVLCGSLLVAAGAALPARGAHVLRPEVANSPHHLVIAGEGPPRSRSVPPVRKDMTRKGLIDVNCDGVADLVSASSLVDRPGGLRDLGAVVVVHGAKKGFQPPRGYVLSIEDFGLAGKPGDQFGSAVAAGDGNYDGCTDIAVGVNGFDPEFGSSNAGAIAVYIGSSTGLHADHLIEGTLPEGLLGTAVVWGDFDGIPGDELAAAAPGAAVGKKIAAGRLFVFSDLYEPGPAPEPAVWTLNSPGIRGKASRSGYFGLELTSGDFNFDGYADLAAGSPVAKAGRGFTNVLFGSSKGLRAKGNQRLRRPDWSDGDFFGFGSGVVRANDDAYDDLLLSAPGQDGGRGGVFLQLGGPLGITETGFFLLDPQALAGDHFGYRAATLGGTGSNLFAFGSPDAAVTVGGETLPDAGHVSFLTAKWRSDTLEGLEVEWHRESRPFDSDAGRGGRDRMGFDVTLSPGKGKKVFASVGVPGFACDGVAGAGAISTMRVNLDGGNAFRKQPILPRRTTLCFADVVGFGPGPDDGAGRTLAHGYAPRPPS